MPDLAGYEVTYSESAFKASNHYEPPYTPTIVQVNYAFDQGLAAISGVTENGWMIFRKWRLDICNFSGTASDTDLMFVVPAGTEQQAQLLAAITCFEEAVAGQLGAQVDPTLRSINECRMECVKCSGMPDWIRYTSRRGNDGFCDLHAREEPNFGKLDRHECVWTHLAPITT